MSTLSEKQTVKWRLQSTSGLANQKMLKLYATNFERTTFHKTWHSNVPVIITRLTLQHLTENDRGHRVSTVVMVGHNMV